MAGTCEVRGRDFSGRREAADKPAESPPADRSGAEAGKPDPTDRVPGCDSVLLRRDAVIKIITLPFDYELEDFLDECLQQFVAGKTIRRLQPEFFQVNGKVY